jgi:membrane protease YdiL (CAAX protease family)
MSLKATWAGTSPYSKFLLAVGVILISAVLFTLISTLAAMSFYGISMSQLQFLLSDFSNPDAIPVLKLIQTVSTIGTFILPPFLIAYLFDARPASYLSLDKKAKFSSALLVVVALIAALPFINFLGDLNSRMSLPSFLSGLEKWMKSSEEQAAQLTRSFLEMHSVSDVLFNVFMIGLLPALGEELLFRGIVQRIFSDWSKNVHIGIWTSAVLFSAMHVQFYGFIPRMMLGALLGYLLVWSGSLWMPILAHFVNNASAVVFTYLFNTQKMTVDPDKVGTENDYVSVVISIILTGALLWLIYKKERNKISVEGYR